MLLKRAKKNFSTIRSIKADVDISHVQPLWMTSPAIKIIKPKGTVRLNDYKAL